MRTLAFGMLTPSFVICPDLQGVLFPLAALPEDHPGNTSHFPDWSLGISSSLAWLGPPHCTWGFMEDPTQGLAEVKILGLEALGGIQSRIL